MKFLTSVEFRSWAYPVGMAVLGLLGGYGVLTAEDAERWNILLMAVVGMSGLGMARAYVPKKIEPTNPESTVQPYEDPVDATVEDSDGFQGE